MMDLSTNKAVRLPSVALICLLFLQPANGTPVSQATSKLPSNKQIETLIRDSLPNASIGVVFKDAKTGKVLYERRAKELFPPASVTKLFTAAASLLLLGTDYRFTTCLEVSQKDLQQEKLQGNLYIRFSGDPSLTSADLKSLISQARKSGIQQIFGNIILEDTAFQPPNYAMGWSCDSLPWYFAAPTTSIILNENQVPIQLTSNHLGEKVSITCESEDCKFINLNSNVISVTGAEAQTDCQIHLDIDEENAITVKGCWPHQPKPQTLRVALLHPDTLAKSLILEALQTEGIQFNGQIISGKAPDGLNNLALHRSVPLTELLKKVLQDSNNIYANSLTKALGLFRFQQGSFQLGLKALKETLEQPTGINFDTLRLFDGSGLSRYNLITPSQIALLLHTMYHDKKNAKIFLDTLPVSGENGTLATCLNSEDLKDRIRAKTGSLANVQNLAGYLKTTRGKDLIFVIMIDHLVEDKEKITRLQEDLCRLFLNL